MSMEYEKSYIHRPEVCPAMGHQEVKIGVPVEIKPFAEVGKVKTECIGKPTIERGTSICEGKTKETCKFTISQKIRIEVPVAFGAKTEIGQARVECKKYGECFDKKEEIQTIQEEYRESEHICRGMIG